MTLKVRVLLWLLPALLVLAVGQFVLVSFFSFQTTEDSQTSLASTTVAQNSDNSASQLGTVISSKAPTETVSPSEPNTSSPPPAKPVPLVRAAPTNAPVVSSSAAKASVPSTSKSAVPIRSNVPKKPKLNTPSLSQKPAVVAPKATVKPVPSAPTQPAPLSSSKPAQAAPASPSGAAKPEVVTPSTPESVAPTASTAPVKAVPPAPSVDLKPVAPVVAPQPEASAPTQSDDNQNDSSGNATQAARDPTASATDTATASGTSNVLAEQAPQVNPVPEAPATQEPENQVLPPDSSSAELASPAPVSPSPSSEPVPVTSDTSENIVPAASPPVTAESITPATPTPAQSPAPVAPSAPENIAPVASSSPPTAAPVTPSQPLEQPPASSSPPATTAAVPPSTPVKPAIVAPNDLDKPVTSAPVKSNPSSATPSTATPSTATSSSGDSNRPELDQVKQNADGFQDSAPRASTPSAPESSPQSNKTSTSSSSTAVASPSVPALKPVAPASTASEQDSAVQSDQLSKLGRLAANGPVLVRQQNGTLEFQTLNNPSGWLLLFSVALLALTLLLGVFGVRRSLAPLYALAREIEHRNASSLDLIATPPMPELRPAVNALNRLLSELGETLERLKTQEQTAKRFAYNASHELRNPLTAARNYLEVLERHPTQIEATQGALGALDRTERILSSLLQLARLEGQGIPKRERIDLSSFLPAHFDVPVQGTGEVWAERDLLELSLDNLVNNATHHAGGARAIRVESRSDATWLWVEDEGPGFNAELLPRAFEPFAKYGAGTGLGLAIVEAVARVHGGTVRAENRIEGGARVGLSLPAYSV